jgi:hypothetical protein
MDLLVECFSSKLKALGQTSVLQERKHRWACQGSLIFLMIEFSPECKCFQYQLACIEYLFYIIHCSSVFPCIVLLQMMKIAYTKTKGVGM